MSCVTVNSNKQEKVSELTQEVESVRAMNDSLRVYLEHLRTFRRNLTTVNENYKQLNKVNTQWIDVMTVMKFMKDISTIIKRSMEQVKSVRFTIGVLKLHDYCITPCLLHSINNIIHELFIAK